MSNPSRIKAAIEFLKDGKSFMVDNLLLGIINSKTIFVTGWTQYYHFSNITKNIALAELDGIKLSFKGLVEQNKSLADFISDKKIEYNLSFNYGSGGIGVCREVDGQIIWETHLNR